MALRSRRDDILKFIESQSKFLARNSELFDIYQGNLVGYVREILEETLSKEYYDKIKSRVIPINILQRLVDKSAKVYSTNPQRKPELENTSDESLIEMWEEDACVNVHGNVADEFTQMFKAYAWEPYLHKGKVRLRTLPYDQFLVMSDDRVDPLEPTTFIKIMGKNSSGNIEYRTYTDEEFDAFDSKGATVAADLINNDGVNPFGVIPFEYGNRSLHKLIPVQDTDILSLTKVVPIMFSDLAGAVMFQCFSIIYGVDVDMANAKLSPNALWEFKSDSKSDKNPIINTIKPEVDSDKVLELIRATVSSWLETRGIKPGAMGQLSKDNLASGISKIVDEMDVSEAVKKNQVFFRKEEISLWDLIKTMHNKWVDAGELLGVAKFTDGFALSIEFDEPSPVTDRFTQVETVSLEVEKKFLDRETAIKRLYPGLSDKMIAERIEKIDQDNSLDINISDVKVADSEEQKEDATTKDNPSNS